MKDYSSARFSLSAAVLIGWVGMVAGVVILAMALSGPGGITAGIGLGLPVFVGGLMTAAIGEIGQAVIETALNSRKSNILLAQAVKALEARPVSNPVAAFAAAPERTAAAGGSVVTNYKGVPIVRVDEGFSAAGVVYESVIAAERAIDRR